MVIKQERWTKKAGWELVVDNKLEEDPQLVFVFGGRAMVSSKSMYSEIKKKYPKSKLLFCSTSGEIADTTVTDDGISLTAVRFFKTDLKFYTTTLRDAANSKKVGQELSSKIEKKNLAHVMLFSEGLTVNGTALIEGMLENLPKNVAMTGGLVGDADKFKKTVIGLDAPANSGNVVAIGFYGTNLKIGYGSLGGWDSFGPERVVTKSVDNVLFELDGRPALDLYKEYLGDKAKDLPSSGLLFPLSLTIDGQVGKDHDVVRTLLAIDEEKNSLTFAGDIPEGSKARLMKANFNRLVDGAQGAAKKSNLKGVELAILISCVGRKLVLKGRVEEEVEAVREVVGKGAVITGFYSYGEISPVAPTEQQCRLHNQTMTITTFKEV